MATQLLRTSATPKELEDAVHTSWSADTSFNEHWSRANSAAGQCAVTALVVQDYLGGCLLRGIVEGQSHYWNLLLDGTEIDLTREQFDAFLAADVDVCPREYVMRHPRTRRRYDILASRVRRVLA